MVCFVRVSNKETTLRELRRFAELKLPNYMIPSKFALVEEFFLKISGKIDFDRLPFPEFPIVSADAFKDSNEIPTIQRSRDENVRLVWKRVLRLESILEEDDFFDLGGNSLLAFRLITEVENQTGVRVPIASLLKFPVFKDFSRFVLDLGAVKPSECLVSLRQDGSRTPLFLIHAKGVSVMLYRNLLKGLASSQPLYALQPVGVEGPEVPISRVKEMALRYLRDIEALQPEGPYFLGGYSFGGNVAFEMACQLSKKGQKVAFLGLIDCHTHGAAQRAPAFNRFSIHLTNLRTGGPAYLIDKLRNWVRWMSELSSQGLDRKRLIQPRG